MFTAQSEMTIILFAAGHSSTVAWERSLPAGSKPSSLSRMARMKLAVIIRPFMGMSALPSRTSDTASLPAASSSPQAMSS